MESAGTDPGADLNAQSVATLAEAASTISGGSPKPVTAQLLAGGDIVVTLAAKARIRDDLVADAPRHGVRDVGARRALHPRD